MLDAKLKEMKMHVEQIVKHKPTIERDDLWRLKESDAIKSFNTMSGFMSPCISVGVDGKDRETWRSPVFYSCRMKTTNSMQPWPTKGQVKHAKEG